MKLKLIIFLIALLVSPAFAADTQLLFKNVKIFDGKNEKLLMVTRSKTSAFWLTGRKLSD